MTADIARNNLDLETSPYLLQHRNNPVHWQAWGPAALAAARAGNKPILLSVGYAACHWCHVMAHESFEKPAIAALMNELFVNIKVDREERPDIDTIYQTSLALLGEQGGWPLTMFLTPDGEPFWGGTYFPPEPRYGRPGFPELLRRVADVFHQDRETIDKNRTALMNGLSEVATVPTGAVPAITPALLDQIAARLLREVDRVQGGIGQAPKFPQSYLLELLWRGYLRNGDAALGDAVTFTLDRMSQGGIYDHLGGGYARYATDGAWLVPHFEKMLYDNALLLDLLCLVTAATDSRLYEARIRETIGWVLRDMQTEGGAFAASQDADSEGVEGKFYVWTETEIDTHLGADAEVFKAAYDVSPAGNWEGRTILNRTARPALGTPPDEEELARLRHVLFEAREQRVKPGWDDKVLADWNGLMIAALAHAGAQFREPGWIAAAARAFDFIRTHMVIDGRLRHSYRHGQAKHSALLDDYASMARAALALFEATGEADYLTAAESWIATLDRHYWDNEHGGYFFTADDAEALISRSRSAADNATPSGNGTALGVLARLYYLTGTDRYRQRAEALLAGFAGALTRNFFPLGTLLNATELLQAAVQIAIIGERDDPATRALIAACYSVSLPNRVLLVSPPGAALPAGHPAAEKPQKDNRPTAYVCIGTTCSLPLTAAEALRQALPQP